MGKRGKRICPKCLAKVPDGQENCVKCGHHLAAPGEVVPPPAWVGHEEELIPSPERPFPGKYRTLEDQLADDPDVVSSRIAEQYDPDRVVRENYAAHRTRRPIWGYLVVGVLVAALALGLLMANGTDSPPKRTRADTAEARSEQFQRFCAEADKIQEDKAEGAKAKDLDDLGRLEDQPAYNPDKVDHWVQFVSNGDTRALLHVGKTIEPSTEVRRVDLIACYRPQPVEKLDATCSYVDPDFAPLPDVPTPTYQVHPTRQRGILDVYEPRTAKLLRSDPVVAPSGPCPATAGIDRQPPEIPVDQRFAWDAWSLTHLAGGKLR